MTKLNDILAKLNEDITVDVQASASNDNTMDRKDEILNVYRDMGRTFISDKGYEYINAFFTKEGNIKRQQKWFDIMKAVNKSVSNTMRTQGFKDFKYICTKDFVTNAKACAHKYADVYELIETNTDELYEKHLSEQYGDLSRFKEMEEEFYALLGAKTTNTDVKVEGLDNLLANLKIEA
jgi:vacuolar-type H+-ATPase catalytic subunit A/Vma1